jgi:predicted dehydrogenase
MTATPIRWGILATGGIAAQFTRDLALADGAEVVAVGSRSLDSARAFAAEHGIPRAYGSWQELAADPQVDIVYVATPHSAHHAATMVCLEAGKAVLCEKPFTLDLPTSQQLVDLARARGLFLMEAMWMATNPTIRRVQEVVASGEIGEIRHVQADFGVPGPFPAGHRMRARELGGGALLDLGVYPVTFAHLFLGAPSAIAAVATLLPEGTDESTSMALGYPDGATATLHCGMSADTGGRAVISGTAGRIELARRFHVPAGYLLYHGEEATRVDVPIRGHGMLYEAEEAMRCLRAGLIESPLVPHEQTLAIMATLDAIRAQTGVTY